MSGTWLAIDTATTTAWVVLADADGSVRASAAWQAGHRHGEELLARIDALLAHLVERPDTGQGDIPFEGVRRGDEGCDVRLVLQPRRLAPDLLQRDDLAVGPTDRRRAQLGIALEDCDLDALALQGAGRCRTHGAKRS